MKNSKKIMILSKLCLSNTNCMFFFWFFCQKEWNKNWRKRKKPSCVTVQIKENWNSIINSTPHEEIEICKYFYSSVNAKWIAKWAFPTIWVDNNINKQQNRNIQGPDPFLFDNFAIFDSFFWVFWEFSKILRVLFSFKEKKQFFDTDKPWKHPHIAHLIQETSKFAKRKQIKKIGEAFHEATNFHVQKKPVVLGKERFSCADVLATANLLAEQYPTTINHDNLEKEVYEEQATSNHGDCGSSELFFFRFSHNWCSIVENLTLTWQIFATFLSRRVNSFLNTESITCVIAIAIFVSITDIFMCKFLFFSVLSLFLQTTKLFFSEGEI